MMSGEKFFIESGEIHHLIEQHNSTLREGDMFIISPNVYHGFKRTPNTPCAHRDILIGETLLKELCDCFSPNLFVALNKKPYHFLHLNEQNLSTLNSLIHQFHKTTKHFKQVEDINEIDTITTVKFIITNILSLFFFSSSEQSTVTPNIIEQLNNKLSLSVYKNQSINDVLDEFHYNKSYLCRIFKEETGLTMTEYVNKIKLKRAINLLLYTNMSVSTIVIQLGFSSESYFFKLFKKHYGISPLQYRKLKI